MANMARRFGVLLSVLVITLVSVVVCVPSLNAAVKKVIKPAPKQVVVIQPKAQPTKPSKAVITPPPVDSLVNKTIIQNRLSRPSWYFTDKEVAAQKKSEPKASVQPVVAPASVATVPLGQLCPGDDSRKFSCYEKYYRGLVDKEDIKSVFDDLRARYDGNAFIKSQCHPIAHVIGREATKKYPTVAEAYKNGDSYCWSGYYHGVLEGIVGKIGFDNLAKNMNGICADLAKTERYSFNHYNCVHGLGHGVMSITDNELPESLKICDNLTDAWERESCWSGAFMENVIVDSKGDPTKYLKPSDPLYPCDGVDEQYRKTCYLMQTSYMLKVTGRDFPKVFKMCGTVEAAHQDTCFQSLGRDASGNSSSDVNMTKLTCNFGTNFQQRSNCIIGAVKDFISFFHGYDQAHQLCAAIDADLQPTCETTLKGYKL